MNQFKYVVLIGLLFIPISLNADVIDQTCFSLESDVNVELLRIDRLQSCIESGAFSAVDAVKFAIEFQQEHSALQLIDKHMLDGSTHVPLGTPFSLQQRLDIFAAHYGNSKVVTVLLKRLTERQGESDADKQPKGLLVAAVGGFAVEVIPQLAINASPNELADAVLMASSGKCSSLMALEATGRLDSLPDSVISKALLGAAGYCGIAEVRILARSLDFEELDNEFRRELAVYVLANTSSVIAQRNWFFLEHKGARLDSASCSLSFQEAEKPRKITKANYLFLQKRRNRCEPKSPILFSGNEQKPNRESID